MNGLNVQSGAGHISPFEYNALRNFFVECYERAGVEGWLWHGMPFHVWRHTAAKDMLEASDWNYGLVVNSLGWESVQALKQHYGRMPSSCQVRGLMKAMDLPIQEKSKNSVFDIMFIRHGRGNYTLPEIIGLRLGCWIKFQFRVLFRLLQW